MSVIAFDHVAIPTANPEEMLRFYRALGFSAPAPQDWRAEKVPFCSIQFGVNKINVHALNCGRIKSSPYTATPLNPAAVISASCGRAQWQSCKQDWTRRVPLLRKGQCSGSVGAMVATRRA